MSHQTSEYLACGMDDHVAKPIDAKALLEAIFAAAEAAGAAGPSAGDVTAKVAG
jgi:CheY-like chemotaxis protein